MLVRAAIYKGQPIEGAAERFRDAINNELIPTLRALPGVSDAWVFWPRSDRNEDPLMYCHMFSFFDDEEKLNIMLGSPLRNDYTRKRNELLALFKGTVSHMEYTWDKH
jgi:hypothetical protein